MIIDGLRNLVANLGTSRDKASASEYFLAPLETGQLQAAYRSSPMARKIVDIPADDAVRLWREWQAEAEQIGKIEAEEKRLGLVEKARQALKLARLYGGAVIYIGTGESDPSQPLRPDTIRKGGVKYLTVLQSGRISAQELQRDPRLPGYGTPIGYVLDGGVFVHPSRMVVLHGADLPDVELSDGWGDSALQSTLDAVKAVDGVAANVLSMTFEAKVDVIKMPDMMERMRSEGAEAETQYLDRIALAQRGKGINGTLLMDGEEEWQQKQLTFGGLPDIWDRFMIHLSAASDIPVTRLWGRAPAGLNATGEADEKNYFAKVGAIQTGQIEPAMGVLDECLIRSALGNRPEDIFYSWRPLGQTSAKDRAEIGKSIAETFRIAREMDVGLPEEAISGALVSALTEAGFAPGFEGLVEDYYVEGGADDTGEGE